MRDLAQSGALTTLVMPDGTGMRRRYACSETPEAIRMPPSVHDVIASRIDRRSPACVALLHTLSTIDGRVPLWLAAAVAGQAPAAAEAVLREAVAAEILVQASLYPDVEYAFAHALLREVAHDSLTRARRVEAHRRIVAAVEAHHVERPQDQAEWLAHHAVRAEMWNKAALYQGQAAERALARGSYAEAIAGMRAALKSFDEATPSPEATQRAIDQLRALRALLYATGGDVAEIHRILVRAEELALGADDRVRLAWVRADQSAQFWVEGDNEAAVIAARQALEIAEQAGDTRLRALALFRLGLGFYAIGNYAGAAIALRRSVELLAGELRAERIGTAGATSVLPAVISSPRSASSAASKRQRCAPGKSSRRQPTRATFIRSRRRRWLAARLRSRGRSTWSQLSRRSRRCWGRSRPPARLPCRSSSRHCWAAPAS